MVISCSPRFQHFTAGVAGTEMNHISSLCSSLASRILWLSFSPSLFLLWCWAFSGKITAVPCSSLVLPVQWNRHHRPLHFLGVGFLRWIYVQLFFGVEVVCGEFCSGAFFFYGIENPAPEITAVPCTSLVLGCSAIDSTRSVYSPATSWQGWKMKIWATRKAAVKWKNTLLKSSYWLCSPMVVSQSQNE